MVWRKPITLALPLIALCLAGCGGGFAAPGSASGPTKLSVHPASATVAAGSTTTFMGVFTPTAPTGGSLTWSITPVNGGTVSSTGIYTASSTAGPYSVVATWTPSGPGAAVIIKGSATVSVLAVPQLGSVISPDQVQASGANQVAGPNQNGAISGQGVPAVVAVDSANDIQDRSSFPVPAPCPGSNTVCQ